MQGKGEVEFESPTSIGQGLVVDQNLRCPGADTDAALHDEYSTAPKATSSLSGLP
jgi:hypothetical protein